MTTRPSGLRESLRKQGLKAEGLRGSLRNVGAAGVPGPEIPDSAISRWSFENENNDTSVLADVWGNNDGTVSGATFNPSGGPDGTGEYQFDSVDVITTPFNPAGLSTFSIAVLFDYQPPSDNQALFMNESIQDFDEYVGFYITDADTINWNNEDGSSNGTMSNTNPSTGYNWTIVTVNSGSETMYENDSQIDTNDNPTTSVGNYSDWKIGGQYATADYFNSNIADIRAYSKELTSTEVTNLVTTGSI